MNEQAKKCLLAMIDGLRQTEGNQYYTEKSFKRRTNKNFKNFYRKLLRKEDNYGTITKMFKLWR